MINMILDINKIHDDIKMDIEKNQSEIFNRFEYYTRKYSHLSDRLNNVNVGLILNENYKPTVQIFIQNKTGYRKTHLVFNNGGYKIKKEISLEGIKNE